MMCKIVSVEFDKLSKLFAQDKLALNISKTNFMIYSNRKSIENIIPNNGVNSQKVDSLRCLGVLTDNQITLKNRITYISNTLCKSIAIIHRVTHVIDTKALYYIYNVVFQPHLNY